jgi:D-sedoheptulose 7-phosphate isomerase
MQTALSSTNLREHTIDYLTETAKALTTVSADGINRLAATIEHVRGKGGTVHIFGNGACASLADHMAADFANSDSRISNGRSGANLRTSALACNGATITALGNDFDFASVFARQLMGRLTPADLLIAISASGASANVVRALETARQSGAATACLTGRMTENPPILDLTDLQIVVGSARIDVIENVHVAVHHATLMAYLRIHGA